jgi:hypothetical protein
MRYTYRILVEIPSGKRTMGKFKLIWEDNIKFDLGKI